MEENNFCICFIAYLESNAIFMTEKSKSIFALLFVKINARKIESTAGPWIFFLMLKHKYGHSLSSLGHVSLL